jgi:hypothetical protein
MDSDFEVHSDKSGKRVFRTYWKEIKQDVMKLKFKPKKKKCGQLCVTSLHPLVK